MTKQIEARKTYIIKDVAKRNNLEIIDLPMGPSLTIDDIRGLPEVRDERIDREESPGVDDSARR